MEQEKRKKIGTYAKPSLWKRFKIEAVKNNKSVTDMLEEALIQYLNKEH